MKICHCGIFLPPESVHVFYCECGSTWLCDDCSDFCGGWRLLERI